MENMEKTTAFGFSGASFGVDTRAKEKARGSKSQTRLILSPLSRSLSLFYTRTRIASRLSIYAPGCMPGPRSTLRRAVIRRSVLAQTVSSRQVVACVAWRQG